ERAHVGNRPVFRAKRTFAAPGVQIDAVNFAGKIEGILELRQGESRALWSHADAGDLAEDGRFAFVPDFTPVVGLEQNPVGGYLTALGGALGLHPVWSAGARGNVPATDDAILAGEGYLAEGGVSGIALYVFQIRQKIPSRAAVAGFEDALLQARGVAVLLVEKPDAQQPGWRLRDFGPAAAGFPGLPDALLGHHPAAGIVEEKQGE